MGALFIDMKTIKIDAGLWKRVEEFAARAGYSSAAEFVQHALEKELAQAEKEEDRAEVDRRLKGLGYLD